MNAIQFSKTKTQLFVEKFLNTTELQEISQSIANAYSAVDGFYKATPALGKFLVGEDLRPHLIRVFVEHSLQKYADTNAEFKHEVKMNAARNCNHLRLFKKGLALTSHYMGTKCERPEARKALYKVNLTERNMDLFEFESNSKIDIFQDIAYAQIMHGGIDRPSNILINIPSQDQLSLLGSIALSVPNENKAQVEEIIEETPYKIKEIIEVVKNGT